jgi:hypothetical protein
LVPGDVYVTVIRHFVIVTQNWEGFGMNTADVATRLNTTARTLRRFLRADSTYANAGSGGKYDFQESDIPVLVKRFAKWSSKSRPAPANPADVSTPKRTREIKDSTDDTVNVHVVRAGSTVMRNNIRKLAAERERHLRELMIEAGLHISQPGVAKKGNPRSYAKVDA